VNAHCVGGRDAIAATTINSLGEAMPGQNEFLKGLSSRLFSEIKPRLHEKHFRHGDVLFQAGETTANIYFPDSGAVSFVLDLEDGQMIESSIVGKDSLVGAGAALYRGEPVYKALVQISGDGQALDIATARHMSQSSEEFRTALIRHEQSIHAQAHQSAACNVAHHLDQRLARWLLRARDATKSSSYEVTQEAMSAMLGVGRTSVSITAHALQEKGLIQYSRGRVTIVDAEGLRLRACECYGSVKHHYDCLEQPVEH
jgi:CRP-like cAMP-binding protein